MREFNTSGPCDPALHYTVMREALLAEGKKMVAKGRYFTIFAPRQSGKTTYFHLLMKELQKENYLPLWISFENLKTAKRDEFYAVLGKRLHSEIAKNRIQSDTVIQNQFHMEDFFSQ